jgi:DNA polymerase III subunit epsilon
LAFDTKTMVLFPIIHRLVEVGAISFRLDSREVATFYTLINPEIPIPSNVQQVHGITDHLVRGQPTIDHVLPPSIEFLGLPDTILLAHSAPFDLVFVAMALTRFGIAYPPHYVCDTLDMARRLYPTWPSHLVERMASPLHGATGALHGHAHAGSSLHRDR